ncbi:MAG TPA: hypothetical protein VLK85_33165 [Ramlibacter sp.]|nr:hypothetical protein [Ramlibacter sp.]
MNTLVRSAILMKADALSGGKPFPGTIADLISQQEFQRILREYQDVAGFSLQAVGGK